MARDIGGAFAVPFSMPLADSSLNRSIRAISSTASSSKDQAAAPAHRKSVRLRRLEPMFRAHSRAREAAVVSLPPSTEIMRVAPSSA